MALTKNEVVLVLNKLKVAYSNDVIEALTSSGVDEVLADKIFKSAFYAAANDNRRIVTGQDIRKVLSDMRTVVP